MFIGVIDMVVFSSEKLKEMPIDYFEDVEPNKSEASTQKSSEEEVKDIE